MNKQQLNSRLRRLMYKEINEMCARYEEECSEVITRYETEQERELITVQCVAHTAAALLSIEVRMGSIMIIAAASCFMYVPIIRSVIHMSEFTTAPIFR